MNSIRGRLRAPIAMLASGAVLAVVGGIGQGWGAAIGVLAVTTAAAVFYCLEPQEEPGSCGFATSLLVRAAHVVA